MNTVENNINNFILNREKNHLNIPESYLEIEVIVSNIAGGVFAMMLILDQLIVV